MRHRHQILMAAIASMGNEFGGGFSSVAPTPGIRMQTVPMKRITAAREYMSWTKSESVVTGGRSRSRGVVKIGPGSAATPAYFPASNLSFNPL